MALQPALWIFLFYTLVGPFLAAVLAVLWGGLALAMDWQSVVGGIGAGRAPGEIMTMLALEAFVWSPFAAAFTAIVLIIVLRQRRTFGPAVAGMAGVAGFFAAYLLFPFDAGNLLAVYAFCSGLIAATIAILLVNWKVVPAADP